MTLGIECLLTDEPFIAREMARELNGLNEDRKLIEQGMQTEALEHLHQLNLEVSALRSVCLHDSRWHQGVIGILASRLKERLHKPVLVFADAGTDAQGELQIKGSARSITGVHIRDLLDAVATHNPGLLTKFGGHAMAAGLSLRQRDFVAFTAALEKELEAHDEECFMRQTFTDGGLDSGCFSLEFAALLREAGPWGQHFPEPVFNGDFRVISVRVLSGKHLKLVLQIPDSQQIVDAIAFNQTAEVLARAEQGREVVRMLYKLDINEYRGLSSPQLMIETLEFY